MSMQIDKVVPIGATNSTHPILQVGGLMVQQCSVEVHQTTVPGHYHCWQTVRSLTIMATSA